MRKLENKAIIWPVYFDVNKTRKEGRRVPKNIAVQMPKILEVQQAAEKLGLKNEINLDAHFPKMPCAKSGMLYVEKKEPKGQIIEKIAKQLIKVKSQQAQQQPAKR